MRSKTFREHLLDVWAMAAGIGMAIVETEAWAVTTGTAIAIIDSYTFWGAMLAVGIYAGVQLTVWSITGEWIRW